MTTPKLTGFMIGLVLISMVAGVFVTFMSSLAVNYSVDFDNSTLTKYSDKMQQINLQAETVKDQATKIEQKPSILDIIGGYFAAAYRAAITTGQSFTLFEEMTADAVNDVGFGDDKYMTMNLIWTGLTTIVIIMFAIGILVSMIVKRDL